MVANGSPLLISHVGNSVLTSPFGSLKLNNVLCVPSIAKNLNKAQTLKILFAQTMFAN